MSSAVATGVARPASRSRLNLKFLIGALLILAAIVYVTVTAVQQNTVYYYTLQEFHAQQNKLVGTNLRINGPLDLASIDYDQKNLILHFNMKDGDIVQPVSYQGVVPDTLKTGESVVAEGKLDAHGVFQADSILVKCPSKYEQQPVNSGQ